MDLIVLVLVLALFGFLVWLITTKIPMVAPWPTVIQVVALILIILWLLGRFALLPDVLPR